MGNLTNMVGGSESFRTGDILKIAVLMHYEDKSVVKCQYAGCDGKTIYNMFAQFVCKLVKSVATFFYLAEA